MASFNEARRLGIGGSDVAAIMGLSPWKTPLNIYFEKVRGDTVHDDKNLVRGRQLEKYILEDYADHNDVELDVSSPFVQSTEFPFLIGNIDARVKNKNVLVEAKSSKFRSFDWDGLPIYYTTQVAHYAMITDCDYVDIPVVFLQPWDYQCFRYNRDLAFEKKMKDTCVQFWESNVLKNIPPQPENPDDARSLFSISTEKSQKATETAKKAVEEIKKIHFLQERLHKKENDLKLAVMMEMQDAQALLDDDIPLVTWKTQTSKRIDSARLKKENPVIFSEFLKESSSRVFRIKGE